MYLHRHLPLLVLLTSFSLTWACQAPPSPDSTAPPKGTSDDPRALLESARQAALETKGVHYRFEFGRSEGPSTWATGETWMLQRTGLADSLIRVEGRLRNWDEEPSPFLYSTDGRSTWSIDPVARSAEVRAVGEGDRSLGGLAVYGYFTEFVEKEPYWKELGQAESLRLLESEPVHGVDCHVVEALYHPGTARETRHLWYLAQSDLLPRGLRWYDENTPAGGEFWLRDVRPLPLGAEDFTVEIPEGFEVVDRRETAPGEAGEPVPAWSLTSWQGETVSSEALRGKVVVLDFWNTWCFICRTLQPQMKELAARYGGGEGDAERDVLFFGVNVFEVEGADPDAYWSDLGHGYDFLRNGDAVAQLYDVPWQPGVVVLGRDGRVVFSLVGGTGDRKAQIEGAIEASL